MKNHNFIILLLITCTLLQGQFVTVDRNVYADRLRAMWLGECIANWTGLQTEGDRTTAPFFTDADWSRFGYVLNQDPWLADDDTDIEYVYMHLLDENQLTTLTPEIIRNGWMKHMNGWIWVSNAHVRSLFDQGLRPPATSLFNANELAIQIDAQLTTEVFGAIAPGMPEKALQMANLPILTTANGHAAHASQFHVLLYSLAALVDTTMSGREQVLWLVNEARRYLPATSKAIDIIDFVREDYLSNPDIDDWESTRDKIYDRYHLNAAANGFRYTTWYESSVNLATAVMCLLYGEMDMRRTVRIGSLSGWDSDNPTATMGGLVGLVLSYDKLVSQFPEQATFSDRYNINRTRTNMPDYLPNDNSAEDTFIDLVERMLQIIDLAVEEAGGIVSANEWILPEPSGEFLNANPLYQLMQGSANNRVREEGGTVTVVSSAAGTQVEALADGFEHDFSGREWDGTAPAYKSDQVTNAMIDVTYDRPVDLRSAIVIEGSGAGGFSNTELSVLIDDAWVSPAGEIIAAPVFDPYQAYQIVNYNLESTISVRGIRIKGPVEESLSLLEIDALATPWPAPENYSPSVFITSPEDGASFTIPSEITIEATAADPDGFVEKIEFFVNSVLIGEDRSEPFTINWVEQTPGLYQLTAAVYDDAGTVTVSRPISVLLGTAPPEASITWKSYEIMKNDITNMPDVMGDGSTPAQIEFYESTNDGGIDHGTIFSVYNDGGKHDDFNQLSAYWATSSSSEAYPYGGISAVGRGQDAGETNVPPPLGVQDMQVHPPENNHLVVAAFVVPFAGKYAVSGLATRRSHNEGGTINYRLFDPSGEQRAVMTALNNNAWVYDPNTYDMGRLEMGDRIYFGVDRGTNDNYYWDATEIAWTIYYEAPDSGEVNIPVTIEESMLYQNSPNPFIDTTRIRFDQASDGLAVLKIYDLRGREVAKLVDKVLSESEYNTTWNGFDDTGNNVSAGIYLAHLEVPDGVHTIKIMRLK
jgi:hypothetical protein